MQALVIVILVAWFLLSVLKQFPGNLSKVIAWNDPLKLIPRWVFFAPQVQDGDFSIIYRLFYPDEKPTRWVRIEWVEPRKPIHCLWNPQRRRLKALIEMLILIQVWADGEPRIVPSLSPYLTILEIVLRTARSHCDGASHIQFAILKDCMFDLTANASLLMKSGLHAFPAS